MAKVFAIMRRAVLMEDEGREHLVSVKFARKEAEDWIAAQYEYFHPQDYYILEGIE